MTHPIRKTLLAVSLAAAACGASRVAVCLFVGGLLGFDIAVAARAMAAMPTPTAATAVATMTTVSPVSPVAKHVHGDECQSKQ